MVQYRNFDSETERRKHFENEANPNNQKKVENFWIIQMFSKLSMVIILTMIISGGANAQTAQNTMQAEREKLRIEQQRNREKMQEERDRLRAEQQKERGKMQEERQKARDEQQRQREILLAARDNLRTEQLSEWIGRQTALSEFKIEMKKEFSVSSSPTLSISNQFGRIRIIEGANDQIVFKVNITGKGKNESEAKLIAESIDVSFNHSGNRIAAETKHGRVQCNNCGRSVDYEVTVPKNTKQVLKNQHGDIELHNVAEPLEINLSFGKLYASELSDANLKIQHGGATINKCEKMQIETGFSQYKLGEIGVISGSFAHSGLKVDELGSADLKKSEFSNLEISRLKQSFITNNIAHGSLKIEKVDENFSKIRIDAKFTTVKVALNKNHNFKAMLYAEFGNINTGNVVFHDFSMQKKTVVAGTAGNIADPPATVEISTQHGGIVFF